jgi:hypothetical protein
MSVMLLESRIQIAKIMSRVQFQFMKPAQAAEQKVNASRSPGKEL